MANNLLDPNNLIECKATNVEPKVNDEGLTIVKVPVVLQEVSIQIPIRTQITFPADVLEIKDIKKRVKLTQGRLVQVHVDCNPKNTTGKLFLSGFVRKNIQYTVPFGSPAPTPTTVSAGIDSFTTDVPFECVASIHGLLRNPVEPRFNKRKDFGFITNQPLPDGYPLKDELISNDLSQFHQESTEHFNEITYTELVRADIIEWDEATSRTPLSGGPFEEGTSRNYSEKMILDLTLKVLQLQQVEIFPDCPHDEE